MEALEARQPGEEVRGQLLQGVAVEHELPQGAAPGPAKPRAERHRRRAGQRRQAVARQGEPLQGGEPPQQGPGHAPQPVPREGAVPQGAQAVEVRRQLAQAVAVEPGPLQGFQPAEGPRQRRQPVPGEGEAPQAREAPQVFGEVLEEVVRGGEVGQGGAQVEDLGRQLPQTQVREVQPARARRQLDAGAHALRQRLLAPRRGRGRPRPRRPRRPPTQRRRGGLKYEFNTLG